MDLRTLRYFITVAEELNITKAAKILNMSQPPLSSQIKNLESELNTTLFIRGKRNLTLTESGQLLYRRAKEIISLSEKAESEISSMSKGIKGTISIGLVEGMAPDIAAEWIAGFIERYPDVKFRILDGNSDDLIEKLRSGLISLAVITAPYDQMLLNSFPVGREKFNAFISRNHPLAAKSGDSISIEDLIDEPLIVPGRKSTIDGIYKWFRKYHEEPRIICEMDSYLDAASLAGKNAGICIFPHTPGVLDKTVTVKSIEGDDKYADYLFVWRKGHPLPSVEEIFIDYIKEIQQLNA